MDMIGIVFETAIVVGVIGALIMLTILDKKTRD